MMPNQNDAIWQGIFKIPWVAPDFSRWMLRERLHAAMCLAQIDPAAEDAVLQMAPSSDPLVCQTAIELLGRLGTQKSLPTLRKAMASRNVRIKQAAQTAVDQIQARTAKGGSS